MWKDTAQTQILAFRRVGFLHVCFGTPPGGTRWTKYWYLLERMSPDPTMPAGRALR
jgi:hypothetical protein